MPPPKPFRAKLVVSQSKATLSPHLHRTVIQCCAEALSARGAFTIALSGGSLPSFLSTLTESFALAGVDPKFDAWHVILADERCVPHADEDSNLKCLQENFLSGVPIPSSQIYGIDEALLLDPNKTSEIAESYEANVVRPILIKSGGMLDLAVLGFGPDGHTCSLFPGHELLTETKKLVAPIDDSPKPPPRRITLTFAVLNELTRMVVFCGSGGSKGPILKAVFDDEGSAVEYKVGDNGGIAVAYTEPSPYPCGMVQPMTGFSCGNDGAPSVVWVVDEDAAKGLDATGGE